MVDSISTSRQAFTGNAAERIALETTNLQTLDTFTESDTSNVYFWDGNSWVQTITGGAAHVTDPALGYLTYSDATYEYYCEAAPGTARSTALWQVSRKTIASGDIIFAGTGLFEHAATDLSTVGALTYTLGA